MLAVARPKADEPGSPLASTPGTISHGTWLTWAGMRLLEILCRFGTPALPPPLFPLLIGDR
jgi:hypothetical protein